MVSPQACMQVAETNFYLHHSKLINHISTFNRLNNQLTDTKSIPKTIKIIQIGFDSSKCQSEVLESFTFLLLIMCRLK